MKAHDKVNVKVPRWTTEQVTLIDLAINRILELRRFDSDEVDVYKPTNGMVLQRIGSFYGLSDEDIDLFDSDRRQFWEKHIDKLDDNMIREISVIHNPNWHVDGEY